METVTIPPAKTHPEKLALHPLIEQAMAFTETYRAHADAHPAEREAACLRTQFPALLTPIAEGEMYAGGNERVRVVSVASIWWALMPHEQGPGKQGGYCFDFAAIERVARNEREREILSELKAFWREECTHSKISATWEADMNAEVRRDHQVIGGGCGFVVALDLDTLLQMGIPGLQQRIGQRLREAAERTPEQVPFLRGLGTAVEVLIEVCQHYATEAREKAVGAKDLADRQRLERIAASLEAIQVRKPESLHEAIQLWWIYSVITCGLHIEGWRLDVALGDFYAAEIDQRGVREEEALELLAGLWEMWDRHGDPAVCRVIMGGRGRRNEANANRLCLAAMEVTRRQRQVIPQTTLRFYEGIDGRLLKKAYDVIGEGCTYPMLYNDDVIIPGVMEALQLPEEAAIDYHPLGCGEYMIGGASPSLLNLLWSIPKALEPVIFGRYREGNAASEGERPTYPDYESFRAAVSEQLRDAADLAARVHAKNNAFLPGEVSYLFASLMTLDCLERGESILAGGSRYFGACVMGHGFTNMANALVAIRRLVFEEQSVSWDELRKALETDFAFHSELRNKLLAAPKFGNDHEAVDREVDALWREISGYSSEAGNCYELGFFTVSSVNPGGYACGDFCGATPDGRLHGEPFAIGNAPTAGTDAGGLTAMLNSVSRISAANGGATTNIKLAKELFGPNRAKLEALMKAFWKRGGQQATLTVVDQRELEDAMEHPERYPNLLVRVGGWSARFVDLERSWQEEILRRTVH